MAIQLYNSNYKKLLLKQLLKWNSIPTAVISDSMNRQNVMASRISALLPGKMVGQARTVSVIAGDNGAIHASMNLLGSNDVLVIDGGAYKERALWGGILNTLAIQRNISGVVIDGAIRDIDELIGMGLPIFFSSVTPAGPHKGWGGTIGTQVSCGGVSVSPSDIVVGDGDGVVIIPIQQAPRVLQAALTRLRFEEMLIKKIKLGEDLTGVFDYPKIEAINN